MVKFSMKAVCLLTAAFAPLAAAQSTIVDVVVGNDDFGTLEAAVIAASLVETLSGDGPFTVFGPPNEAFEKIDADYLKTLLTKPYILHLTAILTFHAAAGKVMSTDLEDGMKITTLGEEVLTVSIEDEIVSLSSEAGAAATVTTADVAADNGVIHIVDNVLLPSFVFETIYSLGNKTDDFSTLISLVDAAGLQETLMGGGLTLLAPTNKAFEAVDKSVLDMLGADVKLLTRALTYHVIPAVVPSSAVASGMVPTADSGSMLTASVDGDTVKFDTATVTSADVLVSNGIIHIIDSVLLPKGLLDTAAEAMPSMSPVKAMDIMPSMSPVTSSASRVVGLSFLALGVLVAAS